MTFTSIICVRKDVEPVLEALSSFGEFHIEQADDGKSSLTVYNQSIQRVEDSLTTINEITKQLIQEKPDFYDIFRISQPTKIHVTAENWQALSDSTCQEVSTLKKEVNDFNASLSSLEEKTTQLNHLKDILKTLDGMEADLATIEGLKLIHITIASVPHKNFDGLKTALTGFPIVLQRCYLNKDFDFACLAMPNKHREEIEGILKIHHARIFLIPEDLPHDTSEALKEVNNRIKENKRQEKTVLTALNKLGKENRNKLASWHETTENVLALLQAKRKILESGRLATVKGFVPKKKFQELNRKVHSLLGEKVLVLENETAEVEDPPTKMSHSRFIAPFEELTKLWGIPHYDELDPTLIMAITFPLVFGLMFGDVGHGLILLAGGLTLGILIKRNQAIKNLCWIIAACGASAIFIGLLYGEFFGTELFAPLWFRPFNSVFDFLIFSLLVGVVQITSGLILEMVNFLLKHNVIDAVLTTAPKIAFYVGAVYLIAVYQLNLGLWFSGPILLIIAPFLFLVFAKPIFLTAGEFSQRSIENQNKKGESNSLGERIFESGDQVTRLLSNTISYARILALLMAHWALLLVTYTIAGQIGVASIPALIISGIIIVGGNIFVLALEGLIVFIHSLRLHFYEWFSKFYQDSGSEFKAFKQNFIYTKVFFKEKQQVTGES
jgi:V/A-type H+-transporting ATPase subunit I